ncbi:MAG: M56 family metallopeptidase [Bacteroidetes bacterium]|nr:M56 family metallopeptidase [Bacteroidota bacterium]
MNLIWINIMESSITMAMFFLIYKAFLSKETFFRLNRVYLLSALLFSVTIPFISLNINLLPDLGIGYSTNNESGLAGIRNGYNELNAVIIYAYSTKLSWTVLKHYLTIIYYIGVITSFAMFLTGLVRMLFIIYRSKTIKYGKYSIVENKDIVVPFSLFKWIIINPEKHSSKDIEQIIVHEKMHAFQLHSLDLIFIEVLVILFWFNPFIYWYRKSIREVHEYLADEAVVENGFDALDYQKLLLSQVADKRFIGLTSSFSYSLSKNRLKMLTMMKSKRISKIKIALVIPVIIVALFLFINPVELVKANDRINRADEFVVQQDTTDVMDDEILYEVEEMPKFNEQGPDAFRVFIQQNLKYPAEAQKNGEQGRVFISFVVNKEGYVQDVEVKRGVSSSLDNEALRVVKSSPRWQPGYHKGKAVNVGYTFPIIFALHDNKSK